MSTTQKTDKADAVRSLLAKLPTNSVTPERKPIIQEIAKEKGKTGRKMHRKEDVTYVRLSPAIPVDLKIEMDVAIKSKFRDVYPTIDTFVEAAIRDFLKKSRLFDTNRLKHCVHWIRVKACLELRKQFPRHCWNITDTRHWQKYSFGTRIESHLQ